MHSNQFGEIWLDFIQGKVKHNTILRKEVFESWLRCRDWGVDPYLNKLPIVLNGPDLTKELERKKDFLNVAIPVIESLYSVVKGSGFGVWVTNERGIVLNGMADDDVREECDLRNMKVGTDFSEVSAGSNAIGTSLHLNRPVYMNWAEHYCEICHRAACCAVPIVNAEGEIVGILSIIGDNGKSHPHTLGMVVAGAAAIQRELQLQNMHQSVKLAHQYVLEMIESLPSGIIVVNAKGIIRIINKKACEMLKAPAESFMNHNYEERIGKLNCVEKTLKFGREQEDVEQYFELGKQKLHFVMSSRPIMASQGGLDGAVVVLREIEAIFRMTNKMAGYKARFTFDEIVGQSPVFTNIINQARSVASTSSNILLLGESGTGKEMVAQAIHNSSARRYGPFVAINCGALPRELIGSELFGYDEGAFTGAKRGGSPGKFELANNGTIFLDEIGDMPLDLQLVLLRVLQDKIVVRLGGHQPINVNVRLIAATHRYLQQMVADGLFRQDLYYRINVITLNLPPLRKRITDIAILAEHFLHLQANKLGKQSFTLSPQALCRLEEYSWPGNVRELENILERALAFSKGTEIQEESIHIPSNELRSPNIIFDKEFSTESTLKVGLRSEEKTIIQSTMEICQGNVTQAAKRLGITRATLYRKMRSLGLF